MNCGWGTHITILCFLLLLCGIWGLVLNFLYGPQHHHVKMVSTELCLHSRKCAEGVNQVTKDEVGEIKSTFLNDSLKVYCYFLFQP